MNEQREVIRAQLSCGVDYYKGEKGDKPVKGVDYFTQEDIDSIIEQIEAGDIDLTSYATKEYVNDKIDDIVETDPTVPEWAKQENKPTYTAAEVGALPANTVIPTVPTNVSAFTNDAGYLTSHQSLENYATKSYVEQVVAGIETGALKRSIVSTLPTTGIDENTIYMVANSGSGNDVYDEYLYVNNRWERIGSSAVDLTDYATKNYVDTAVGNIPAYTLPTASTSTLGGVKVDGSTITITDGVISATSSGGGSSYTAGDGISIDSNNVISATSSYSQELTGGSIITSSLTAMDGISSAISNNGSELYKLTVSAFGMKGYDNLNSKEVNVGIDNFVWKDNSGNKQITLSPSANYDGLYVNGNKVATTADITTYTAGNGISIANGVISLNLTAAEGVGF